MMEMFLAIYYAGLFINVHKDDIFLCVSGGVVSVMVISQSLVFKFVSTKRILSTTKNGSFESDEAENTAC